MPIFGNSPTPQWGGGQNGGNKLTLPNYFLTARYLHKLGLHAKNETSKSKDKKVHPPNLKHVNQISPFCLFFLELNLLGKKCLQKHKTCYEQSQ